MLSSHSISVIALLILAAVMASGQQACDLECKLNKSFADSIVVGNSRVVISTDTQDDDFTSIDASEAMNFLEKLAVRAANGPLTKAQLTQLRDGLKILVPYVQSLGVTYPEERDRRLIKINHFVRSTVGSLASQGE